MASLKKYYSLSGNSILESVIALSIISICMYIAIMVYANVFSPRTSPKFYGAKNKMDELFFLIQVQDDSLSNDTNPNVIIEEEWVNANLKQITVEHKDSLQKASEKKQYFIQTTK